MIEEPLLTRARGLSDDAFVRTRGRKVFVTTVMGYRKSYRKDTKKSAGRFLGNHLLDYG